MASAKEKTLARIHRVRTLQLGLTRAEEARAQDKYNSESQLSARIAQLADAVTPVEGASAPAYAFGASAHFRDRLLQSASAAEARVQSAEFHMQRTAEATKAAKRDQSAVEKLIARAEADSVIRDMKALEDAPQFRKIRHDPC